MIAPITVAPAPKKKLISVNRAIAKKKNESATALADSINDGAIPAAILAVSDTTPVTRTRKMLVATVTWNGAMNANHKKLPTRSK